MEFIRRALQLDKFSVIGHSFGGLVSMLYSATYPEFIDKTVTIDALYPRFGKSEEVI